MMRASSKGGTRSAPAPADRPRPISSRLSAVPVVEDDLGAVPARRRELGGGRVGRHDDRGLQAEELRDERDGLGVVAGGVRHDLRDGAALRLGLDLVVGAAELEGSRALKVLRLEEDARPALLVELARAKHGRRCATPASRRRAACDVLPGQRDRRRDRHRAAGPLAATWSFHSAIASSAGRPSPAAARCGPGSANATCPRSARRSRSSARRASPAGRSEQWRASEPIAVV